MIGPSAPNGPPVPIAIAADAGLAIAVRGAIRLCSREHGLHRLRDAVAADDRRPLGDQRHDQSAGHRDEDDPGLRWRCVNDGSVQPTRWKNARLVSSAIRCTSTPGRAAAGEPDDRGQAAEQQTSRRGGVSAHEHIVVRYVSRCASDADYEGLLAFRDRAAALPALERAAGDAHGVTPAQYQLLLAIRGHPDGRADDRRRRRAPAAPAQQRGRTHRPRRSRPAWSSDVPTRESHRVVRLRLTPLGARRLRVLAALHLAEVRRLRRELFV